MVQLQILSGRNAGTILGAFNPPVSVGRSQNSDVPLDEAGVFDTHCKIHWVEEGLVLETEPDALASINGEPTARALLRNGDTITLGGATLRFSLSPVRQPSAALREWLTMIGLAALCLGQVALIYWLNG